jgi:hypothetical protein
MVYVNIPYVPENDRIEASGAVRACGIEYQRNGQT